MTKKFRGFFSSVVNSLLFSIFLEKNCQFFNVTKLKKPCLGHWVLVFWNWTLSSLSSQETSAHLSFCDNCFHKFQIFLKFFFFISILYFFIVSFCRSSNLLLRKHILHWTLFSKEISQNSKKLLSIELLIHKMVKSFS